MAPALVTLLLLTASASAANQQANPVAKVLSLLSDLQAKINAEAQEAKRINAEEAEYCSDHAADLHFQIETTQAEAARLAASVEEGQAVHSETQDKIEDTGRQCASRSAELREANSVRASELTSFTNEDAELLRIISALERATDILQRNAAQTGAASLLQQDQVSSVVDAIRLCVDASMLRAQDATKLTAMLQTADPNAPSATVYQTESSTTIVDVLQDLAEKTKDQLAAARKHEQTTAHSHGLLKQSLETQIKSGEESMTTMKAENVATAGQLAGDGGDLGVAQKSLASLQSDLAEHESVCKGKMSDYAREKKSRSEELAALAEAQKVLSEGTVGAEKLSYSGASFLQEGTATGELDVLKFVRNLAREQPSPALAQLESRMVLAVRASGADGTDPFSKIKGLITDLINNLVQEAAEAATEKSWCDNELAETRAKRDDSQGDANRWQTKLDQTEARIGELSREIAQLQDTLAKLAEAQRNMDATRKEAKALFVKSAAEMTQGIEAVQLALKTLRNYYAGDAAHNAATGAGSSIIGILEVVASDMTKTFTELQTDEQEAEAQYVKETQENEVTRTNLEADVKYKTKERTDKEATKAEVRTDLEDAQSELKSNLEYLAKVEERCIKKAETYASRKSRREALIQGLKDALEVLQGRTAAYA